MEHAITDVASPVGSAGNSVAPTADPEHVLSMHEPHDLRQDLEEVPNPPRRFRPRELLLLASLVTAVRLLFSVNRNVFHLTPDEPAIFGMARWMSGGTPWNMFNHNTWQPGMSVLLVPLFWMTDRPDVIYHGALAINAALGGLAAVMLARLALRITDMPTTVAALASGAIALMPASLAASSEIWAEPLVTVTFLGCLTLTLSFVDDRRFGPGAAAIVIAAAGYFSHGRLLPLLVTVAAMTTGVALLRRRRRLALALALVSAAAGGSAFVLSKLVIREVWDQPNSANTAGSTLSRLIDPLAVINPGVGQLWYLLASTALVFGIGTIVITSVACGRRRAVLSTSGARTVATLTMPLLATSVVFMSGSTRPDMFVYGRYNDAVVWPVLLVGVGWVVDARNHRRRSLVQALAGVSLAAMLSGLYVAVAHNDEFRGVVPPQRAMIPGILFGDELGGQINPAMVTLLAIVAFGLLMSAARSGPAAPARHWRSRRSCSSCRPRSRRIGSSQTTSTSGGPQSPSRTPCGRRFLPAPTSGSASRTSSEPGR